MASFFWLSNAADSYYLCIRDQMEFVTRQSEIDDFAMLCVMSEQAGLEPILSLLIFGVRYASEPCWVTPV
jgi:hypothetical protein